MQTTELYIYTCCVSHWPLCSRYVAAEIAVGYFCAWHFKKSQSSNYKPNLYRLTRAIVSPPGLRNRHHTCVHMLPRGGEDWWWRACQSQQTSRHAPGSRTPWYGWHVDRVFNISADHTLCRLGGDCVTWANYLNPWLGHHQCEPRGHLNHVTFPPPGYCLPVLGPANIGGVWRKQGR